MTDSILSYFAQPGPTTELTEYSDLVSDLPSDPKELARIVRGLVLHEGIVEHSGMRLPTDRLADRERVGAAAIVGRVLNLEDSPLSVDRKPENRMVGYCYHFAVLHCAFLRAKGVPSRARCGFADYYSDQAWIDHWVVEYWNRDGWVVIDPDSARNVVSAKEFHNAGVAWQLCRAGDEDPRLHGNHVLWGWDELRGSLINDIGALNKFEVGEWGTWCNLIAIKQKDQPSSELDTYLDTLAGMVTSDSSVEALWHSFDKDERLRPPVAQIECKAVQPDDEDRREIAD